ncbi:MAG TPA: hypothetical protein GX742_00710 [Acholeplasmataceae bacterium]|nr:hypothetical protein [Acholeplasmataceae bacterium]
MKKLFYTAAIFILALLLVACGGTKKNLEENLEQSTNGLRALIDNPEAVVQDFVLPTKLMHGVEVEWTVDENDFLAIGTINSDNTVTINVTRPEKNEGDFTITLKANLTLNDESLKEPLTSNWSIPITILEEGNLINVRGTVENIELNAELNDWVKLDRVTVLGVTDDYIYVGDQTGFLLIDVRDNATSAIRRGETYTIQGRYSINENNQIVLQNGDNINISFVQSTGDKTTKAAELLDILDVTTIEVPTESNPLDLKLFELTGFLNVETNEEGLTTTYFVSETDYDFANETIAKDQAVIVETANNIDINRFENEKLTFKAFLTNFNEEENSWTIMFMGDLTEINGAPLTVEEQLKKATAEFVARANISEVYEYSQVINMFKKYDIDTYHYTREEAFGLTENQRIQYRVFNDVEVTWGTNREDSINPDNGAITLLVEKVEDVIITAKLNAEGFEPVEFEFLVKVGSLGSTTKLDLDNEVNITLYSFMRNVTGTELFLERKSVLSHVTGTKEAKESTIEDYMANLLITLEQTSAHVLTSGEDANTAYLYTTFIADETIIVENTEEEITTTKEYVLIVFETETNIYTLTFSNEVEESDVLVNRYLEYANTITVVSNEVEEPEEA